MAVQNASSNNLSGQSFAGQAAANESFIDTKISELRNSPSNPQVKAGLNRTENSPEIKQIHAAHSINDDVYAITNKEKGSWDLVSKFGKKAVKTALLGLGIGGAGLGLLLQLITIPALAFPFYILGGLGFLGHLMIETEKKAAGHSALLSKSQSKDTLAEVLGKSGYQGSKPNILILEPGKVLDSLNHIESDLLKLDVSIPENIQRKEEIKIDLIHLAGMTDSLLQGEDPAKIDIHKESISHESLKGIQDIKARTEKLLADFFPKAERSVPLNFTKKTK